MEDAAAAFEEVLRHEAVQVDLKNDGCTRKRAPNFRPTFLVRIDDYWSEKRLLSKRSLRSIKYARQ